MSFLTFLHNKFECEPLNHTLQVDYKAIGKMITNKIAAAERKYFNSKYGNCKGNQNKGNTLSNNF